MAKEKVQKEEEERSEEEGAEGGRKIPKKLLVMALAGLLVAGGGGFAYFKFFAKGEGEPKMEKSPPAAVEAKAAPAADGAVKDYKGLGPIYPLDPFIVNLADESENRYLKTTLQLELSSEAVKIELDAKIPMVRDTVLILVSSKTYSEVKTTNGKFKLREELISRLNGILASGKVNKVFFTEFVVQ